MSGVASLPASPVDGYQRIQWVPVIADVNAPKLTEINATGSVDLSCYMTSWNYDGSQDTVTDQRVCSTQKGESPGMESRTLDVGYIENPGSTTINKAYTTLPKLTSGFFVQRRGKLYSVAFAVGDPVDVIPVITGLQIPDWATGQTGKIKQKMFVQIGVADQVLVVA